VYTDLKMLRNMYPRLIRQYLEVNNDTVLFLPFYDSIVEARKLLAKNKIDVKKFENKEESLIIMDACRAYFGSFMDIISSIR
jgi:CRISPR/Cas system CSM-associated protein Csm5 (group 7 of RAMP superfamily)